MANLEPRQRKARPAPEEPPVGAVSGNDSQPISGVDKKYPIPHDLEWARPKTLRMTKEHEELLNELKFRHDLKIQEAVWYALENTYGNK